MELLRQRWKRDFLDFKIEVFVHYSDSINGWLHICVIAMKVYMLMLRPFIFFTPFLNIFTGWET